MPFVPQSNIRLLHSPLDPNGQNQIRFSSVAAQSAYFSSLIVGTEYSGLTYQRHDNIMYVPEHIDNLWSVNYCMYQNNNFNSKWFYAFVTKMEYINDECTALTIKTDVFQTWMLSCTLLDSFIVRSMPRGEGVSGYMPGDNLIEENLETGEYICNTQIITHVLDELAILVLSSEKLPGDTLVTRKFYNGLPSGLFMLKFSDMDELSNWIDMMTEATHAEAIVSIFVVPKAILLGGADPNGTSVDGSHVQIAVDLGYKPTTLDQYTPRNKKLLTYPYNFMYVSNRNGQSAILKYEYFLNDRLWLKMDAGPQPNCEIKASPADYKGMVLNTDESLTLTGYPCIAWISDVFKTWLAQNAYNIPINIGSAAMSVAAGVATQNAIGVAGGLLSVAGELAAIKTHELMPDQARGTTTGSCNIGMGIQNFLIMQKTITREFAERLDQFFDMYGYKQNRIAKPDIDSRAHWNYIKTIDCNISGEVPGPDMEELKSLFNNGLTIWSNGSEIGNYTLQNYEVT